MPLVHLLTHARPSLRELASIIVITPNVNNDWLEALMPLMWRGAVPTVLLLDPETFGGEAQAGPMLNTLTQLQIASYRIGSDLLERPEAQPGQQGRWQWKISGTGKASLAAQPGDLEWKPLG
jgi:hypothetical protein